MNIFTKILSIRLKIVLMVVLNIVALILCVYIVSETIISKSYSKIEQDQTITNIQRANDAIESISTELTVKLTDWAYWDDTYQYMQDQNTDYSDANLQDITLFNLNMNAMLFVSNENEIVFKRAIDLETVEEISSESIGEHVLAN